MVAQAQKVCPSFLPRAVAIAILLGGLLVFTLNLPADPSLYLTRETNGLWRIGGDAPTNSLLTLEASPNLADWDPIAVLHPPSRGDGVTAPFTFADFGARNMPQRFYRFSTVPLQPTNDWKNQIHFPGEEVFLSTGYGGNERWVKFVIPTNDPPRVFYGGRNYDFHYEFATARLELFRGVSPTDFERQTLFETSRRAWLGSVLYPRYNTAEYGIQFVAQDVLPPERVRVLLELVRSTVIASPSVTAFYIPTFEQVASAEANRAYFVSNGIPVSTAERWVRGDICYSEGWGIGQLKFFSVSNVNTAYADGRLRPEDILLTDGIPAELPYVSGIVSLAPSTANSHVAILARSYGVPFIYLVNDTERARVLQLIDREVVVQATTPPFYSECKAAVIALDSALDPGFRAEILALKTPPPVQIAPKEHYGAYTVSTDGLMPSDIRYFGGKAANYGVLRRTIPDNVPEAIAISFDLWDDFMDQIVNGRPLRQEISNRLSRFSYPADVAALQLELASIRDLIRNFTQFTTAQQNAIIAALSIFDPQRNIRFRSSTNVEDAESFSGAGLYDSFSGCLADDQDGNSSGPSICDPTETGERGVFRAIRRVFASFYNNNAFLERLRLGIDENTVGMAMLVHHSTPDPIEMANGVATLNVSTSEGRLVTQKGAVSVANPDGTASPEEIRVHKTGGLPALETVQFSSLLPRGDYVLEWSGEYYDLCDLLFQAEAAYWSIASPGNVTLDLEYKKVAPGHLEIKQVREVPEPPKTTVTPYLLNQTASFVSYQGYYANLWATHRLKSRWTINTRNMQLTESNLNHGILTEVTIEHLDGTNVTVLSGPISSFPDAEHNYTDVPRWDAWTMGTRHAPARVQLNTFIDMASVDTRAPFKTSRDFGEFALVLEARHQNPVPVIDNINNVGQLSYVTLDRALLRPLLVETTRDVLKAFTFNIAGQGTNAIIQTSYWIGTFEEFGERPPMMRFVETRIAGFTTEPIVLRSFWSQTFSVTHRNGSENFIFEPRLDPEVTATQLDELAAARIAYFYLNRRGQLEDEGFVNHPVLKIVDLEGNFRTFSDEDFEW